MDLRLPYYMMYPIPYAFDEEKIQKRDREYLQSMYPATAKRFFHIYRKNATARNMKEA